MSPLKLADTPPVWLALFLLAGWMQARVLPLVAFGAAGDALGGVLTLAGLAVILAAAWEFRRHRTTIVPHLEPSAMIDTGIYRLSRNPIYLADLLILVGLSLRWDALVSLVAAPLFVRLIRRRFIEPEEARLRAAFGLSYEAYLARVRRWI